MPAELQMVQPEWHHPQKQTQPKQGLRSLPGRAVLLLAAVPLLLICLAAIPLLDGNPDTFFPFAAAETESPETVLQLDPECSPFAALRPCVNLVDPFAPTVGSWQPSA